MPNLYDTINVDYFEVTPQEFEVINALCREDPERKVRILGDPPFKKGLKEYHPPRIKLQCQEIQFGQYILFEFLKWRTTRQKATAAFKGPDADPVFDALAA